MSLRIRLNLLITLLFILVLLGGSIYIIRHAKQAVYDEMQSTAHLTLQLIETMMASGGFNHRIEQQDMLNRLASLESTRHLYIAVLRSRGHEPPLPPDSVVAINSGAPHWFEALVRPVPLEFRRIFAGSDVPYTEILIRADPTDEITEAWYEARSIFLLMLLFIVLTNLLLYFTLGRDLAPIENILMGLERIERGEYQLRLPRFNLPELTRIAERINRMAEVLQRSREQNRHLAQRSLEIQEDERRHLARELHDELGQSLTAIKAVASTITRQSGVIDKPTREGVGTIISISDRMYDVARNMMQRLRPTILDELGLVTALQEMVDNWNGSHGDLFCHLDIKGDVTQQNDRMNISLYRIIQESLTNISKHARAGEVHILLARRTSGTDREELLLEIRDDGIGFEQEQIRSGMGLLGIRERVEALDGIIKLDTAPGQGVDIQIVLPLEGESRL